LKLRYVDPVGIGCMKNWLLQSLFNLGQAVCYTAGVRTAEGTGNFSFSKMPRLAPEPTKPPIQRVRRFSHGGVNLVTLLPLLVLWLRISGDILPPPYTLIVCTGATVSCSPRRLRFCIWHCQQDACHVPYCDILRTLCVAIYKNSYCHLILCWTDTAYLRLVMDYEGFFVWSDSFSPGDTTI
jgi:hypothetical protein